jgi:hypothetical protein
VSRRVSPLTTKRLRELLNYDPLTGAFTWRVQRNWMIHAGHPAGRVVTREGHVAICIDYVTYTAGRLAWQWMTGVAPTHQVEHKNGDAGDSRWRNLRDIGRPGHAIREGLHFQGYALKAGRRRKRFAVRVYCDGRTNWVGSFETATSARLAYWFAKALLEADA